MRRAFTLLELLVIVGILGAMMSVSVLAVSRGREAARIRGAARDVFACVRQARSIALVTGEPAIISFKTEKPGKEEEAHSTVTITSAEMQSGSTSIYARNLDGEWKHYGGGEDDPKDEGGTVEEVLFSPISQEVLSGVRIKVVMDGEDEDFTDYNNPDEVKKSSISAFSNVDFLLGAYREAKAKREAEKAAASGTAADAAAAGTATAAAAPSSSINEPDDEKSVVWQVNGRCDGHKIYICPEGKTPGKDGWTISVDGFGAAKILSADEVDG